MADQSHPVASAAATVAIILAVALGTALNMVTAAMMWATAFRVGHGQDIGLSENAVQLLTGAFGGIIGALSAYLGYALGRKVDNKQTDQGVTK